MPLLLIGKDLYKFHNPTRTALDPKGRRLETRRELTRLAAKQDSECLNDSVLLSVVDFLGLFYSFTLLIRESGRIRTQGLDI